MSEEQRPFVHQDGSTTPLLPASSEAINTRLLALLINELGILRHAASRGDPRIAAARRAPFDQAIAVLARLREPSINATLATMVNLDPRMQALVCDVVLALSEAGTGRQNLAIALRKLIEGRS